MNRLALALLLLAGCGAEGPAPAPSTAQPATAPPATAPPSTAPPATAPAAPATPAAAPALAPTAPDPAAALLDRLATLPGADAWTPAGDTPLAFATHHPQGLARVGDTWYLSTVEVTEPPDPKRATPPFDRSPGAGIGHLVAFTDDGALRARVTLGEGPVYHPGGIDTDGARLYVPVAEYRPRSRAIVYAVDPATLAATALFRFPDHLGALIVDGDRLIALSWGGREVYTLTHDGRVLDRRPNPSGYVDHQDCRGLGHHLALCAGVRRYRAPDGDTLRLGGLEVIDLARFTPAWQLPIDRYAPGPDPRPLTYNATDCDFTPTEALCAFVPADQPSTLHRYHAAY
ncbi:MAG: hypothetical protein H6705_19340 [Myxococcales bacterium]|nr:hypothetical protein [Myxococcales bacterium]